MAKKTTNIPVSLQSMGGKACLKKHGNDFYRKIAEERWTKWRLAHPKKPVKK